jgi:hypothetical protein
VPIATRARALVARLKKRERIAACWSTARGVAKICGGLKAAPARKAEFNAMRDRAYLHDGDEES